MEPTPDARRSALLALNGTLPPPVRIEELRRSHARFVAADGAAIALHAMGIEAEVIIGDLDSIGTARRSFEEAGSTVIEEASQETNDFEKALRWIADNGCERVTIVGIDGGMIDHTINNMSVLARFARNLRLEIVSGDARGRAVHGRWVLATGEGARISLIPLPSARVTTSGLAWELDDETLAIGVRDGASNRALAPSITIDVHEGILLVIHYPAARE